MNIKKVDDKPMVIHTKEKTKLHVKQKPEAKIKGRNVLVVEKCPKIAGTDRDNKTNSKKTAMKGKPDTKEQIRNSMQKEIVCMSVCRNQSRIAKRLSVRKKVQLAPLPLWEQ
jgi:predicted GTPase